MEEKIQHTKDTNFFLSARLFRRVVLLARPIKHAKMGGQILNESLIETTRNIDFRSLLPKQDLQLSF